MNAMSLKHAIFFLLFVRINVLLMYDLVVFLLWCSQMNFYSAHLEWNLDGLLEKIWEYLNLTRIYTKPKGMNPDYDDPVILSSKKRTIEDFCNRIHKDMSKQYK